MKFLTVFLLFAGISIGSYSQQERVYRGLLRVKLKPEANGQMVRNSKGSLSLKSVNGATFVTGLADIDRLNREKGATSMGMLFQTDGRFSERHAKYGLDRWYEIKINANEDPEETAKKYMLNPSVEYAEPVYTIKYNDGYQPMSNVGQALVSQYSSDEAVVNDPEFGRQWAYQNTGQSGGVAGVDIRLPAAWEITTGSPSVIVAVVDGGVDLTHEDLKDNLWTGADGKHGISYASGTNEIDATSHGTHVAGTIAARSGNGIGCAGIAGGMGNEKGVQIMTCQIFLEDMAVPNSPDEAIVYACDNGAVILQNSWGYTSEGVFPRNVQDAIDYFIDNAGKDASGVPRPGTPMVGGLVIFAAGNEHSDGHWYPGYYERVLAVGSVGNTGKRAYYSNYGDWVDISAPGGDQQSGTTRGILSTTPRNTYSFMQGTSMACPHVSGVAALVLSKYGNSSYTPDQLRQRLTASATPLAKWEPEFAARLGSGLVNARAALEPNNNIAPDKISDLRAEPFSTSAQLTWTAPTDADNGTATSYQIAVSMDSITNNNFSKATIYTSGNTGQAGSTSTFKVPNLTLGQSYFVAVKALDLWKNTSRISNVVKFTCANHAPMQNFTETLTLSEGITSLKVNLDTLFTDGDGDVLTYELGSFDAEKISIDLSNRRILTIRSKVKPFTLQLSVTATDPMQLSVVGEITIAVEGVTGIDDQIEEELVTVWPVPTSSILHYSLNVKQIGKGEISVYGVNGQLQYSSGSISLPQGLVERTLDISGWPSGTYILKYTFNNKIAEVKKISKQ